MEITVIPTQNGYYIGCQGVAYITRHREDIPQYIERLEACFSWPQPTPQAHSDATGNE